MLLVGVALWVAKEANMLILITPSMSMTLHLLQSTMTVQTVFANLHLIYSTNFYVTIFIGFVYLKLLFIVQDDSKVS